jgi:hypothetical protein
MLKSDYFSRGVLPSVVGQIVIVVPLTLAGHDVLGAVFKWGEKFSVLIQRVT